ncbi:uncharacterized protein C8Q71DRAFT_710647 [Rhodofomes roseus]|uniref:CxC5 like cysteine cluster associated with KDZ domain-containing protein n=1 Tax=Rhodofomes roseus TaxID=34475 RepID=A0ABQ8KCH6_9APHY|nr:uncharacterized protein C8Q71DRAFT_710647 [Rhodofomes roseus]KAH9834909.1 hypothetical protein C8Q71DRAFT_710647 [Rhodofomes roseus]
MPVLSLLACLQQCPEIVQHLSIDSLLLLFRLLQCLKERLSWFSPCTDSEPPLNLPSDVKKFLASALHMSCELPDGALIDRCWSALRKSVWASTSSTFAEQCRSKELLDVFAKHGIPQGIGFHDLYPRTRVCLDSNCKIVPSHQPSEGTSPDESRKLTRLVPLRCVNFTREFGPIPVVAYSAQCRSCFTRYYPDYYVHERRGLRSYYPGVPPSIEVAKHTYIEATLCEQFSASMVFAWVSGQNNAKIYQEQHWEAEAEFPLVWPIVPRLDGPMVSDAFFLFALLRDHDEHETLLVLQNDTNQSIRLSSALLQRNTAMVGPGQEQWNHICDRCCAQKVDGDTMRAVVTDGVTVGRPCCGVHDCKGRLLSQRARFCDTHINYERQCSILGCENDAESGFKTCTTESHRAIETAHTAKRSALSDGDPMLDDELDMDEEGGTGASTQSSPKVRARFGRRWTHNEQLCVATCGVVLGRMTMYGSEAVSGVKVFLRRLFPTQHSLPRVIFYDSACQLKKHLLASGDTYFDNSALPVDVFHMKSKHKESDEFCGFHCNPARWPELHDGGVWRFNSSAAEMTNAWFGGFISIVREMREDRYDFFLDEVIKQRNCRTIHELALHGAHPRKLERSWLLAEQ